MKSWFVRILAIWFFLATFPTTVSAAPRSQQKRLTLPDKDTISSWLDSSKVPIVGIGLIENGKVKQAKVFGELRKGIPAPDNTIFNVASLTKPVVAILTLKLTTMKRWSLDEPLSNYFVDP